MPIEPVIAPDGTAPDTIGALLPSWRRSLAARRVSPRTIATYTTSAAQLETYLAAAGMPTRVGAIRREHVEAFIADLLSHKAPATAHNRFRGCQAFFAWLLEEGEITTSPMVHMRPPRLPEAPPPVLREPQIRRLLEVTGKDRSFAGRRDEAILRLFLDTGCRRAELLGLQVGDVELDTGRLRVTGKGSRTRLIIAGASTVQALDRYRRARAKRPDAALPWFWLGRKGRLQETGLAKLVRERGAAAGLPGLHPHAFRHAYAHTMLAAGMQESDLMAVAGWKSREMLTRYAAATRAERALAAAKALSPLDRLDEKAR